MTKTKLLSLTLAVGLLICGCGPHGRSVSANRPGAAAPTEFAAQASPPIKDLPVPQGFALNEKLSNTLSQKDWRYVHHQYEGRGDKEAIARFYRRNMQIYRWKLTTEMLAFGLIMLDFEKDNERSRIIISPDSFTTPSRIVAQVWTSGREVMPVSR